MFPSWWQSSVKQESPFVVSLRVGKECDRIFLTLCPPLAFLCQRAMDKSALSFGEPCNTPYTLVHERMYVFIFSATATPEQLFLPKQVHTTQSFAVAKTGLISQIRPVWTWIIAKYWKHFDSLWCSGGWGFNLSWDMKKKIKEQDVKW